MTKQLFKIEKLLKHTIKDLEKIEAIEVDDLTFRILNYYNNLVKQQRESVKNAFKWNDKEIDAFSIGDAIADGICLVDNNGIVVAINKGYTEITEINEDEIVGMNIQHLVGKEYFTDAVSMLVVEKKKKVTALSTIMRNNKKVLITGNPFFDDNGEVSQVMTVMRDLTELIKARDELEKSEENNEKYLNELEYLRKKVLKNTNLIGESFKMKEIKELIRQVANTDATILITGETGCGKEVVSREIHDKSNRKSGPYIKVNCAAISDSLIESELFGYEKGAFTGALNKAKLGLFEMAKDGTILLDEISEMPLSLQSKLLRVLQEKEILRVGGTKSIKLDIRVIAATNQHLDKLVQEGKFREDLYYRLNVVPINIPPLRERKSDISILVNSFLKKMNKKYGKQKSLHLDAMQALEAYKWPGNVRELQNVIERLIVVHDEKDITYEQVAKIIGDTKLLINLEDGTFKLKDAVNNFEKEIIEKALREYGSTYKAAKVLGLTQPTVFRKAKALGIELNNR
jgi:PAS domain S-box-containing protein